MASNPAHNYLRILSALRERPWAITPEALRNMNDIVEGKVSDLFAVAAKRGEEFTNAGGDMTRRGSTAILNVSGPIFRYANLMTSISGATSVQMAALDFNAAIEDDDIECVVLLIDSPGGEVDGISSFADQIRAATEVKPVIAFVDGLGASAAYWLASAASSVIADESSRIGSIGVVATVTDKRGSQERQGMKTYEIVSSQSPKKRPDPATDSGLAQLQEMVDETADLFISRVAQFRGVTPEVVQSDFGQGKTLTAKAALNAGMIDKISPLESFLRSLQASNGGLLPTDQQPVPLPAAAPFALEGEIMPENTALAPAPMAAPTVAAQAPQPDPVLTERARVRGIMALAEAKDRQKQAQTIALDTDLDIATAQKVLAASPVEAAPATKGETSFEKMMNSLPVPNVGAAGAGPGPDEDSPAAEAARVLAWIPDRRKVKQVA